MLKKRISNLAILLFVSLAPGAASAQNLEFIRDAEIENTIRMYATPLFQQAGVEPSAVEIHLVKDNEINAFVAEGLNLFINTGLIVKTEHAGQLIGVIAHETGHIAGGHLVKGRGEMENAGYASLASMILGAAAAVASRRGDVGSAIMMGGNEMAERSYLAFSRTIEGSADTAALTFLDNLHMSARGFLEFMELLGDQELLVTARQDPYVRTHPLTRERVDEVRHHVENSPWSDTPVPPAYVEPHRRIKAKLIAFIEPAVTTLYRYKESDTSLEARYARAIAYYRKPDLGRAIPLIDGLIAERPEDPYFHELKGQMLFENGRTAEAVPEYKLSVKYLPDNALLREELGQVELELEDNTQLADAKEQLTFVTRHEPENANGWRLLATSYGRMGDETMAASSMAEYALLTGRWNEALHDAMKALKNLKKGTPTEIRMQDVRSQAEQMRDRSKNQGRQ
ncbi:M48 family metalloprotease [Telmatospirillum sp.]|uniref:M48 family metalloprotease n=1 Tax=Telmatospirillum sp. TaxID=2079197 RepID=UPI002846FBBB|nr:M48 family metalloprotease [Telmatospirillum sp.]MDR3439358.1 M48 family metalloprotease [Telmatospirillum sp.]